MKAFLPEGIAIIGLLATVLAFGLSATAQAESGEQEPIATARVAPSPTGPRLLPVPAVAKPSAMPMSTSEQIDAYLRASPTTSWQDAEALDRQESGPEREIRSQVGAAVGTGGYRSAYVQSDIPVGRDGNLSIFVQPTQGGRGHGYGRGYGYDSGYGYGGHSGQSLGLSFDLSGQARAGDCREGAWDRGAQRSEAAPSRLNRCARPDRR